MKETVIQFGGGNFLRGFADHFIHILNEQGLYDGKAVIVQSTNSETGKRINEQNGRYNLLIRGVQNGSVVNERTEIRSVSRCVNAVTEFPAFLELAHNPDFRFILSNTTEAGIAYDESCRFDDTPPSSYPAKLTRLLYERFTAHLDGFVIFACELIDDNGAALQDCVMNYIQQWELGEAFAEWILRENKFCSTLVDRIVTGYPKDEAAALCRQIGYEDRLIDTAEPYYLWVIEGDFEKELPLKKAGLNVLWTDDVSPYKKRKVRVLNGAHTSAVFPALLCGVETVKDALKDEQLSRFMNACLFDCILPVLEETRENRDFADAVLERFSNPYVEHQWQAISLNSVSKFRTRVVPTSLAYQQKFRAVPKPLAFSLACLIEYYKSHEIKDDRTVVEFIRSNEIPTILSNTALWGEDLFALLEMVEKSVALLNQGGAREAITWALS